MTDGLLADPATLLGHGPIDTGDDSGDESFDLIFEDEAAAAGSGERKAAPPPPARSEL